MNTSNEFTRFHQGPTFPRLDYRDEVAHLIDFYCRSFVGRQQEWIRLARFAAQEAPGYLLIEAPSGYGKSTLMAHLVHGHQTGRWDQAPPPDLLYFFIRRQGMQDTARPFLQALNSQLLGILRLPDGVPTDLSALRGQFSQLWSQALQAAGPEKPLLLLIDGLDEAAAGEPSIAHLLPSNLAPYVHIVVSSSPNPLFWEQVDVNHPLRKAQVLILDAFDTGEIEQLLQQHGVAEGIATSLSPRILAVTAGAPLFARFVCQEVATGGKPALARLEQSRPASVEAYFGQQLEQLDTLTYGDRAWEILGLLVVALGEMTAEEIGEVLDAGKRQTCKAIKPLRRFLRGEARFGLMHAQLHQVVAEAFWRRELEKYRHKLLDWCQSYAREGWPPETPDYVLAYYAQHLRTAGKRETLYTLIDKHWLDVQFERTYSHRAFAEDVALAIEAAGVEEPPNLVQIVRGSLICATLGNLATNVPPEVLGVLAQVGQAAKARGYASLMQGEGQQEKQCRAYCLIGEALVARQELREAREVLGQVLAAAEMAGEEFWKPSALAEVARLLALAGEVDGLGRALAAAEAIGDERYKAHALGGVAQALALAGEQDRAAQVANQALAAARTIGDEEYKAAVLIGVAQALAQAGDTDGLNRTLAAADALEDKTHRAAALSGMARALAQAGQQAQAMETADRALAAVEAIGDQSPRPKADALREVAQALAQVGALDGLRRALATAEALGDEWYKADALGGVAQALARAGAFDLALATAGRIRDQEHTVEALSGIAQALAQAGEKDRAADIATRALATAGAIEDEWSQAHALSKVAQALAQVGERGKAAETASRALTAATAVEDEWSRARALTGVAQALAQAGEFDGLNRMLATAERIRDREYQADVLSGVGRAVAQALAQTGEQDRAAELANRTLVAAAAIGDEWYKADALSVVAQALAQAGQEERAAQVVTQALAVAEAIGDEWPKAGALSKVARALAQAGERDGLNRVLAATEAIGDKWSEARALGGLAQALAQVGEKDKAAEIAYRALRAVEIRALMAVGGIWDDWLKASALGEAAQALAQAEEQDIAAEVAGRALQTVAGAILSGPLQTDALNGVAQALAWAGEIGGLNQLLATAELIDDDWSKAVLLSGVAQALVETGGKYIAAEVSNRALTAAEAIEDRYNEADALSRAAQALAQAGEKGRAAEIANRALAVTEGMGEEWPKAVLLSRVAEALAQAGQSEQALRALCTAFTMARLAGRQSVFEVLEHGVTTLAAINQGQTLWHVYQAVLEVDGWWGR